MSNYQLVALLVLVVLTATLLLRSKRSRYNFPSYARNENVQDALKKVAIEKRGPWEVFDHLAKKYGSICSFHLSGKPVIVLSSVRLGWDLLGKRGDIYSSRPRLIMGHEILSGSMRGLSSPYNDFWKKWRKIQHVGMSARGSWAYREHQTLEATIVLRDMFKNVEGYQDIIQRFAASVVLSISYGRRAASLQDEMVISNVNTIKEFQRANSPGKFLVDAWPILLWLPRFMQWFRHEAAERHAKDIQFYTALLRDVRKRMDVGSGKECMSSRCLTSNQDELNEVELAYCVASPFGAGVDTTASTIEYFILAAVLNSPQTNKAQAELDKVVGADRLPTFEDEAALPYVGAYIKEIERWRPVVPMAVPHSLTRDDEFEGFHIPKSTTVWANIYTMMKDPELFPDPDEFRPERFLPLDDGTIDARLRDFTLPFGFGRRQCPGKHVAHQSLYILVTRLLWAFDIVPVSEAVRPDPEAYINHGLVRGPAPFRFALRPRSPDALRIVELEAAEADLRLKEWD